MSNKTITVTKMANIVIGTNIAGKGPVDFKRCIRYIIILPPSTLVNELYTSVYVKYISKVV